MEELVTKMRVRKGLKVCISLIVVVTAADLNCSLKSPLWTHTTTSYNEP